MVVIGLPGKKYPKDQRQEIDLQSHFIIKVEEIDDLLNVYDSIGVHLDNECN